MSEPIASMREQMRNPAGVQALTGAMSNGVGKAPKKKISYLMRVLRRPSAPWVRRHERFACCIVGVLDVIDKSVPIDGLVTEVSEGGLLFRPASNFVFDRRGSLVSVRFGETEFTGEIVVAKSTGYGVRFHEEISAETVQTFLAQFGLPAEPELH